MDFISVMVYPDDTIGLYLRQQKKEDHQNGAQQYLFDPETSIEYICRWLAAGRPDSMRFADGGGIEVSEQDV